MSAANSSGGANASLLSPALRRLLPVVRGSLMRVAPGGRLTVAVAGAGGADGAAEPDVSISIDASADEVTGAIETTAARAVPRRIVLGQTLVTVGSGLGEPRSRTAEDLVEVSAARSDVMRGRVAVVTGGAQGFGAEIAESLVANGARVFIVDLNLDGARNRAAAINEQWGAVAHAIGADIGDAASVEAMMDEVLALAGGVDLFVANAGIVRAGSVKSLDPGEFELVTRVNYTGFFLCARSVSTVMGLQNQAAGPAAFSDIVQINSKSGLTGSNKNGAYAGSKFGGIGLVQSFALELAPERIKVNAICPGNFLDGPLWSDPEKGLFVQYLEAGKVPGATSVADVKRHYEKQVPLGRGCRGEDVVRALLYIVEQEYETGQAVPVTGGQIMLS